MKASVERSNETSKRRIAGLKWEMKNHVQKLLGNPKPAI
jgi:hypothetical protein